MREELVITGLLIDRMYGRSIDLHLDHLSDGVNILFGPNGSGKTTLARGIESVLWPASAPGDGRIVDASMLIDRDRWRATLERGRTTWRKDGAKADAPPLPAEDQRDRYQLLLPELIASDDDGFARLVMREMVGGVDIRAAADALKFKMPSPRRTSATNAAEQRMRTVAEVERRHTALRSDRDRLGRLRDELESAQRASRTVEYLEELLEALRARDTRLKAEQKLAAFPEGLVDLRGDEMERLAALREDRKEDVRLLEEAREAIETNLGLVNSSRLERPIPADSLVELDECVRQIGNAESRVQTLEAALKRALEKERSAWETLGIGVERERAQDIDIQGFEDLSDAVRKKRAADARADARRQFIELIGEPPADSNTDDLRKAADILFAWTRAVSDGSGVPLKPRLILVAAGILHIVVGAVLGVMWSPLGYLLVLAGLGSTWIAFRLPSESGESISQEHRRNFERTGIDGPDSWTSEAVWDALDLLQKQIVNSRWSDLLRQQRRRAQQVGDSPEQIAALKEARRSVLEQTGLDADLSDEGLTYIVGGIRAWQEAHADVTGTESELEEARDQVEQSLDRFHEVASVYGEERPTDSAEAGAAVSRLRAADTTYRDASSGLRRALKDVDRLVTDLKERDGHIEALFKQGRIEPGDDAGLAELCRRKDAYDTARDTLRECVGAENARFQSVRSHQLFDEDDVDRTTETVESKIDALRDSAERVDRLREEIRSIEQEISRAERSHDLELARSELEEALVELDRERINHFRSMAGAMLTDFVAEQTYDEQLPAVVKRARAIFSKITAGRYELRFRDSSFTALDTVLEQEHELRELSTGTRVQLLLSVRIAFIEEQERGVRLPVVLDETLANSDDTRADAIVRTVLEICKTGRQVFYLTARDDEVAQWKRVLDTMDDVDSRVVLLSDSHQPKTYPTFAGRPDEAHAAVPAANVPAPDSRDHAEYGHLLDIDPWSPYAPIGALHLWYLIDDVDALHEMLTAGYERWGQLRSLIRDGDPSVVGLTDDDIRTVTHRAEAIDAWKSAWGIGRGRPVDESVLEQSGAVSDKFLDQVSSVAEEMSFDGAAIVRALREGSVSGFYTSKMDELERWLIEHEYIDESGTLDTDEIWTHTVQTISDRMTDAGLSIKELKRLIRRVTEPQKAATPSRTAGPSEA